ncbi:MAG: prephenate dehydrogenase [Negativicutes bacterium]|nr:prephenate dehydrogenase [Negativicutes bacterium]
MKGLRIAIIGVGLIGGSLGLALRQARPGTFKITGIDSRRESLAVALDRGAVDETAADPVAGVSAADIVFLCTPVLQIPGLIAEIAPHLKDGAIVTDVGSTKGFLRREITALLPAGVFYIGGHPMAGREKSGIAAADGTLFADKMFILTPLEDAPPAAVELLQELVGLTGARVTVMDVDHHDRCAAVISHIPHIAAAALVNLLARYPGEEQNLLNLAGGGFCDTTRIASSDADMWADICLTNSAAIGQSLDQMQAILDDLARFIRQGDRDRVHAFFKAAKARRDSVIASL